MESPICIDIAASCVCILTISDMYVYVLVVGSLRCVFRVHQQFLFNDCVFTEIIIDITALIFYVICYKKSVICNLRCFLLLCF